MGQILQFRLPTRQNEASSVASLDLLSAVDFALRDLADIASHITLDAVRERAILIYELDGRPLAESAGGPVRLLIPDYAACKTAEVDECANVKFVDRIELTAERGFDNRPQDESEHAKLHGK